MSEETCVLVCGSGEIASAIARRLFVEEYAVALHQATLPRTLRRRMSFADAWSDGAAILDGVEARRADLSSEFLLGLRTRQFIPVLTHPFTEVAGRWPWDVIVGSVASEARALERIHSLAAATIGLGAGYVAGSNCDLVVEIDGPDPGAIVRQGPAPLRRDVFAARECADIYEIAAPAPGLFETRTTIGAAVEAGDVVGLIGSEPAYTPVSGRVKGLLRKGRAVVKGSTLAEITTSGVERVAGVSDRSQLISRGVAFAVEMEVSGLAPVSFEDWR